MKAGLEAVDDLVYDRLIFDEANNLHLSSAFQTEEGVYFIDFTDHLRLASGGNKWSLVFNDWQIEIFRDLGIQYF